MHLASGQRWHAALSAGAGLRDQWGEVIFRFSLGSLRRLGLFNADPHPGNYLFHDDGTVTFLDFGCVKRFTGEHIATLRGIVQACVDGNADRLYPVLEAAGFVDAADSPSSAELLTWFSEPLKPLTEPQPFTYTLDYAAAVVNSEFSPFGEFSQVTRRIRLHPDYLMLTRIDLGLTAVLAGLRATGQWAAIRAEWDCGGPPGTPRGESDAAFWAGRL
jgi:hypothetical protein